jgi:hypothetical protein
MLRLGVGRQDVVLAVEDDAGIDAFLRSAHMLEGWPLVDHYRRRLIARVSSAELDLRSQPKLPPSFPAAAVRGASAASQRVLAEERPALAAWQAACARFAPEVHRALSSVETAARKLCAERLEAAKKQIQREAKRYLTGFDDSIFEAPTLRFPKTTVLASNDDVKSLRVAVRHVEEAEADETLDQLADALVIAMATVLLPAAGLVVALSDVRGTAERAAVRAALRDRLAADHPVLHRMDPAVVGGRVPQPPDLALVNRLTVALARTWAAANIVQGRAAAVMVDPSDVGFDEGPAAALGKRLAASGIKGGGGFLQRLLGTPLGPWEYQTTVAEAVTDIVGPGPSATRQAVTDAYTAADKSLGAGFTEAAATMGALVTMHLVAPPLAVIADVALAMKGIAEHLSSFLRDRDAYNCALNPSDSLGLDPSVIRLALQCAGEAAGGLPTGKITTLVSVVAPLTASLVD